jgi:hypothetical protein
MWGAWKESCCDCCNDETKASIVKRLVDDEPNRIATDFCPSCMSLHWDMRRWEQKRAKKCTIVVAENGFDPLPSGL